MNATQSYNKAGFKKENIQRAIEDLDVASHWLIENAIQKVLTKPDGKSSVSNTLIDEFSVIPFSEPGPDREDELPRYIIDALTIFYDINLIQRTRYKGSIYEYWVISTSSRALKPPAYDSARKFIISQADSLIGKRSIIKESDQFFHEFSVGDKAVLNIDAENDMEIRETLGAWIAPQYFKNYPQLTRDEVILDAEGNYYLKSESKNTDSK